MVVAGHRGYQKVNGITYVYEGVSEWDKEKKRSVQKRKYIGKSDEDTGELIPNRSYIASETIVVKTYNYGNFCLLDNIVTETGLKRVVKKVFPNKWEQILTCAIYSVCTGNPMYLCGQWSDQTINYCNKALTSQRISELFKSIKPDDKMRFFHEWAEYRKEHEYLAYDITSISSYSNIIDIVEYGYNRDKEKLPQINMGMLFGETSLLPIFYKVYPGSISDSTTIENLLKEAEFLKMNKVRFVTDKGMYSENNITSLLNKFHKFTMAVPFRVNLAKNLVDEFREQLGSVKNSILVNDDLIGAVTIKKKWLKTQRNMYYHVYFDEEKYTKDKNKFMKKILRSEEELKSDERVESHEKDYAAYFTVKKVNQTTIRITRKEDEINQVSAYKGYVVIMSNDIKDAKEALAVYRTKDVVEKAFDNIKNQMDLKRLRIQSEQAMNGKIFINFIALVLLSAIHKVMQENDLYKTYTITELLMELQKINKMQLSDNKTLITEISKKQRMIFETFNINLPVVKT